MKIVVAIVVAFILFLQYEFWFAKGSMLTVWHLKHNIAQQQQTNQQLKERNDALVADINNLKEGNEAVEERARNELGMVKKGETFYQVVDPVRKASTKPKH